VGLQRTTTARRAGRGSARAASSLAAGRARSADVLALLRRSGGGLDRRVQHPCAVRVVIAGAAFHIDRLLAASTGDPRLPVDRLRRDSRRLALEIERRSRLQLLEGRPAPGAINDAVINHRLVFMAPPCITRLLARQFPKVRSITKGSLVRSRELTPDLPLAHRRGAPRPARTLRERVLHGPDQPRSHDLPLGLRFDHRRLLGQRIDPLAHRRLLDDDELREPSELRRPNSLPTSCPNRSNRPKLEPTRPHESCGKGAGVCASPRSVGVDGRFRLPAPPQQHIPATQPVDARRWPPFEARGARRGWTGRDRHLSGSASPRLAL
jgi:hypothetical protein